MAEKSGIEMLEEILQRLVTLEKRLDIMDKNIKTIANSSKLADLLTKASGTPLDGFSRASKPGIPRAVVPDVKKQVEQIKQKAEGFKNFSFQSTDAAKSGIDRASHRSSRPKGIMVKGRLKIDKGTGPIPLPGVSVTIYDPNDKVVKKTKTNRAGLWMSQLAPGKYVALFEGMVEGKKLQSQNKNFEVPEKLPEGQTEFEVI